MKKKKRKPKSYLGRGIYIWGQEEEKKIGVRDALD
jgi:hypothetical protein